MHPRLFTALLVSLLSAAGCRAQTVREHSPTGAWELFRAVLAETDTGARAGPAAALRDLVRREGGPIFTDSGFVLLSADTAGTVTFAGDLNGWNPAADTLARIPGTPLRYLERRLHPAARFEYKLVRDGTWMLDPLNPRRAAGGFGPNSELAMPHYIPPPVFPPDAPLRHGRLDTLRITSIRLGRSCPALVYVPDRQAARPPASLFIFDGMDYIRLASLHLHLDRLIGEGAVEPVVGVFLEPRASLDETAASFRMTDYAMSDSFIAFLTEEAVPLVRRRYASDTARTRTGVLGASLGGLTAAFAAVRRPDLFGFAAPQSASFWWNDTAMIRLVRTAPPAPVRWVITTGTIRDAEAESRIMADLLRSRGLQVTYREDPEGHNWINWRGRLDLILTSFAGRPR